MAMLVRDTMSTVVLTIRPDHTLRDAARKMSAQRVGAAVVVDPRTRGIGILTERDVLDSVGWGQDPDHERAEDHLTSDLIYATGEWTLDRAARTMSRGGFRHLVVLEDDQVVGMISVRDIVAYWTTQPARVDQLAG